MSQDGFILRNVLCGMFLGLAIIAGEKFARPVGDVYDNVRNYAR